MHGVMNNYFEIAVWRALRNAIQNGYEEYVFEEDLAQVAIDLSDRYEDVGKFLDSGRFDINYVIKTVDAFRKYHEKVKE